MPTTQAGQDSIFRDGMIEACFTDVPGEGALLNRRAVSYVHPSSKIAETYRRKGGRRKGGTIERREGFVM